MATVLPLNNAAGMPYWYVLTDRMVTASERLCEEALAQDTPFDPYRASMTSAMTEEMFFTSFVEGAQIPLQEAMDFLQRGTEPESIQEQMIWNNRRAWVEMMGTIYRPLDESFVRAMAFMLTEEMNGCAEDYRQSDQHTIAAMNNEHYEVPPAYTLPDRMNEYYAFLQKPDVHPLIKAAVAQAYLLVTRPFPEGNERLSRMMSSAVLLRCGYDFFRDISISAMIAKESYRYYKCMCEIIRGENGGDLTYFVEYYLELLVRALDARKERQRRHEQETLEQERALARQPLRKEEAPADVGPVNPVNTDSKAAGSDEASGEEAASLLNATQEDQDDRRKRKLTPQIPLSTPEEYLERIDKLRHSPNPTSRTMSAKIRILLNADCLSFTSLQWADLTGCNRKQADQECRHLFEKGLADRECVNRRFVYTLRIISKANSSESAQVSEAAQRDSAPQGAAEYLSDGGMTRSTDTHLSDVAENAHGVSPPAADGNAGQRMMQHLRQMAEQAPSDRDRRIAAFLLEALDRGIGTFRTDDWVEAYHGSRTVYGWDLRRAVNLGLIRKERSPMGNSHYVYIVCVGLPAQVRCDDLTKTQREILTRIHAAFHDGEFSVYECADILGYSPNSTSFHVTNFTERGILTHFRHPGKANSYSFAVTPMEYPQCFQAGYTVPARKHTTARSASKTLPVATSA